MAEALLSAYDPSWRDRMRWGFEDLLGRLGASRSTSQRYGDQLIGSLSYRGIPAADFVPGLGNALAANEAKRAYDEGDWVGAGLGAVAALPPIPAAKVGRGRYSVVNAMPAREPGNLDMLHINDLDSLLSRLEAEFSDPWRNRSAEKVFQDMYPTADPARRAARAEFGYPRDLDLRALETYPGTDEAIMRPWQVMTPAQIGRAERAGANTDLGLYHGTAESFPAFDIGKARSKLEPYIYATDRPRIADQFSGWGTARSQSNVPVGANTIPLLTTARNIVPIDVKDVGSADNPIEAAVNMARGRGGDALALRGVDDMGGLQTQYVFWDPSLLRSRFAAFDPAKRDSSDLLAGLGGLGLLGGGASMLMPSWYEPQE